MCMCAALGAMSSKGNDGDYVKVEEVEEVVVVEEVVTED